MAVSRLSIAKFLELAIAVACIGLHTQSYTLHFNTDTVSSIAFGGYIIILIGGFAGYMASTPNARKIDVFYSLVGCGMFIAAGAMNIDLWRHGSGKARDYGLAKASLAIINGAIFLIDALLSWRGE